MNKHRFAAALLATAALAYSLCGHLAAWAATVVGPDHGANTVPCVECGMSAEVAGRFTSRLTTGGTTRYFCDIGDLVAFIERTRPQGFAASVRDFPSGDWLDAGAARFVLDKKAYATPMGWGVAAFRDGASVAGPTLDFEALRRALR
ncbi:MAG TPA: hypothetical protein VN317_03535 [Candidatus Methanoperedens sp.]|nr:hypothetical protein [Candidatus Methanoperedens sp.]